MKVAYVHDWLITRAGAERVLEEMLKAVPADKIFTLFYEPEAFEGSPISEFPVEVSFLSYLPKSRSYYRNLLPLMPVAIESFDLSNYDVVISSSHAVAKGVITHPGQIHISYVHTPMRYAWDLTHDYVRTLAGPKRFLVRIFLSYIRLWDYASSQRVDVFIANSKTVADRIKRYYGRESTIIYPPVDIHRFKVSREVEDYFIVVSRLVPYKRIDIIVEAFRNMEHRLLVVGKGPELSKLKSFASKNVDFLGWVDEDELPELLSRARAFIFAAYEDFGISPVEAMASGVPVIAYGRGGVTESVEEGISGVFFYERTPEAVRQAVERFLKLEDSFDRKEIRRRALRFSPERFREEFKETVERAILTLH